MNTCMGNLCEFVVIRNADGTYSTFPAGEVPAGVPIRNPRKLTVSGQGAVPCPPRTAPPSKLIEWVRNANSEGYFATLRNP